MDGRFNTGGTVDTHFRPPTTLHATKNRDSSAKVPVQFLLLPRTGIQPRKCLSNFCFADPAGELGLDHLFRDGRLTSHVSHLLIEVFSLDEKRRDATIGPGLETAVIGLSPLDLRLVDPTERHNRCSRFVCVADQV